jgi:hypothetical protein
MNAFDFRAATVSLADRVMAIAPASPARARFVPEAARNLSEVANLSQARWEHALRAARASAKNIAPDAAETIGVLEAIDGLLAAVAGGAVY